MNEKQIAHLSTLIQFSFVYTIVYIILETVLNSIGWLWWVFGIIFVLVGIAMYFFISNGFIVDYVADYLIYMGISFILYDIFSILVLLTN